MPRGASPRREREYRELKRKFHQEHRYPGREEEVASRIVNKQRSEHGETKAEKSRDRHGRSSDRGLPIQDYQQLTVDQVTRRLKGCSHQQLEKIKEYEKQHKNRKTLMEQIDRRLS